MIAKIKSFFGPKRTPFAMGWNAWERFYADYRRAHPIKFFFYRRIPIAFGTLRHRLRDFYWWFQHRLNPRHRYHIIRTGLSAGYHDIDEQMLYGCFALLCQFIDACPDERDWQHDEQHSTAWAEICSLHSWWTIERPAECKHIAAMWETSDGKTHDEAQGRENSLCETDQQNLMRLIAVRKYLWT